MQIWIPNSSIILKNLVTALDQELTSLEGIVDSNNMFLWYESEDITPPPKKKNKNKQTKKCFSWFQFYVYKLCMIMCIDIAP